MTNKLLLWIEKHTEKLIEQTENRREATLECKLNK